MKTKILTVLDELNNWIFALGGLLLFVIIFGGGMWFVDSLVLTPIAGQEIEHD